LGFNGDLYQESGASVVMTTKGDIVRYDSERERYGIGSTNQVLSVTAGLPAWKTLTTADSVLTTQGDVLYESASGLARLGQSTDGYVLTTKGAGANPVWAEVPASTPTNPSFYLVNGLTDNTFVHEISTTTDTEQPSGIAWNLDGTKMYLSSFYGTDSILEYDLTTAYDILTATLNQTFAVTNRAMGVDFNNDGTKMYVTNFGDSEIEEYALSSAFDISTASLTTALDVSGEESQPTGSRFNNDGTKMYVCGQATGYMYEYSLSSAYDLTTASYSSNSFDFTSQDSAPRDIQWNSDGSILLMLGYTNKSIYQYNTSTGFLLSGLSYSSNSFSVNSKNTEPYGLTMNGSNDSKIYFCGEGSGVLGAVYQFGVLHLL